MITEKGFSMKFWRLTDLFAAFLGAALLCGPVMAQTFAGSVSQHGITWYFDTESEVGRYANGDWWVKGPVTIIRITPESTIANIGIDNRVINGTMVNPVGGRHGYDSWTNRTTYDDNLNKAPSRAGPLTLESGSVVSSIHAPSKTHNNGPFVSRLAILTVVSEVPAAGSFRPPPYGTDKTSYWRETDLDYSILRSLPLVPGVPDYTEARHQMRMFWNEQIGGNWTQTEMQALDNQPNYGANISSRLGDLALMLHLDLPADVKRDVFVGMVQYGLDIYGRILANGSWGSDGGHAHGRKFPMLLAGLALNDQNILYYADRENAGTYGYNLFQEDGSTFVVNQAQIDHGHGNYTQQHLGLPEWGVRYWQFYNPTTGVSTRPPGQNSCDSNWGAPYRYVGNQYVAHALAARLTVGGVSSWNWQPFFDYADRHRGNGDASGYGVTGFTNAMWDAYRDFDMPSEAPPKAPDLSIQE